MSIDWEQTFRKWSKPSSDTEAEKAANAERMIRTAIKESNILATKDISVFAQGSYRNNTNVREDSDVDICVCCNDLIIADYSLAPNLNDQVTGLVNATYTYQDFKNDIYKALLNKFGSSGISRGDKAFDIHANSYRIDADVVPAMQRRLYLSDGSYQQGTQIISDKGIRINNWPEQNYKNGVKKNNDTNNRFKLITRAIKRLRNHMAEKGIKSAEPIPSYLIECLVYLVPDYLFSGDSYQKNVENCISHIWHATKEDSNYNELLEINNIKYLFHTSQKWNRLQVHDFMYDAWNYIKQN